MSELSKLSGKAQKFKVGDIEISIKPLSVADMDLMIKLGKEETQAEATLELLNKVLKQAFPDSSEEEIKSIDIKYMTKIMEAVMEVNGLDKKDVNSDVLEKIKARQGLSKK